MIRRLRLLPILLSLALFCSCSLIGTTALPAPTSNPTATASASTSDTAVIPNLPAVIEEELQVIVFDVGQADCILLKTNGHAMLIDAGNLGQDNLILGYLASYGITRLDYLVATHPHADHIGAMAAVIRAMESVGMIVMPDATSTTRTFENLLDAIEEKDVPITIASPGSLFELGETQIQILAPIGSGYADLNDFSVVLRVEFGNVVFLFTGDAETKSENEQLASGVELSADVLKVGHHGSRTSSIQSFLQAVTPRYAVISCGAGNTYGHPHSEALARLTEIGAEIYRTDENGTVIFTTDGNTITVSTEYGSGLQNTAKPTYAQATSVGTIAYIGNVNSKIFHLPTCGSLPQEQNRVYFANRDEAIDAGYTPCSICKP